MKKNSSVENISKIKYDHIVQPSGNIGLWYHRALVT